MYPCIDLLLRMKLGAHAMRLPQLFSPAPFFFHEFHPNFVRSIPQ